MPITILNHFKGTESNLKGKKKNQTTHFLRQIFMRIDPDREDGRVVEIIQLASNILDKK